MKSTIRKHYSTYRIAMDNFENDLDSILEQLLSYTNQSKKPHFPADANKSYSLKLDYSSEEPRL